MQNIQMPPQYQQYQYPQQMQGQPLQQQQQQTPMTYGQPIAQPQQIAIQLNQNNPQAQQEQEQLPEEEAPPANAIQTYFDLDQQKNEILLGRDFTPDKINLAAHQYYVFFEFNRTNAYAFDFINKKWQACPNHTNYTFPVYFRVAQLPDFSFLMTGGSINDDIQNSAIHYYDGEVIIKRAMKQARRAHCTIFNGGYVYVFGGLGPDSMLDGCERYNFVTDTWEDIDSLSEKRSLLSCCNVGTDLIYLFGGYSEANQKEVNTIERYDIKKNKNELLVLTLFKCLQNVCVVQINQKELLILGGYSDDEGDSTDVSVFNYKTGLMKKLKPLSEGAWSMYPPYYINGSFFLFVTGEDNERPDVVEYILPPM